MFFLTPFLATIFLIIFLNLSKSDDFWSPPGAQLEPKWHQKSHIFTTMSSQKLLRAYSFVIFARPCSPKPSTFILGLIFGPSRPHFLTFCMICHAFHATFFNFFSCRCPFRSKFMFSLCFSPIFQKLFIAVAASFCQLLAFKCFASTASISRCRRSLCVYNPPTPAGVRQCQIR